MTNESLTEKELLILNLIAKGYTSPLIANELGISLNTIKWYRKRLIRKFSASTSGEMVRKAIEDNLI